MVQAALSCCNLCADYLYAERTLNSFVVVVVVVVVVVFGKSECLNINAIAQINFVLAHFLHLFFFFQMLH